MVCFLHTLIMVWFINRKKRVVGGMLIKEEEFVVVIETRSNPQRSYLEIQDSSKVRCILVLTLAHFRTRQVSDCTHRSLGKLL